MIALKPSITTLRQASQLAAASHLHLITRNGKTVLSPVVPKGWAKVGGGNTATAVRHA